MLDPGETNCTGTGPRNRSPARAVRGQRSARKTLQAVPKIRLGEWRDDLSVVRVSDTDGTEPVTPALVADCRVRSLSGFPGVSPIPAGALRTTHATA